MLLASTTIVAVGLVTVTIVVVLELLTQGITVIGPDDTSLLDRGWPSRTIGSVAAASAALTAAVIAVAIARQHRVNASVARVRAVIAATDDPAALVAVVAGELRDEGAHMLVAGPRSADRVDHRGLPADPPSPGERAVPIDDEGAVLVLAHDRAVSRRSEDAVIDAARLALQDCALRAVLQRELNAAEQSRVRSVRRSLEARRELEGLLHDGAQATLFAALAEISRARSRLRVESAEAQAVGEVNRLLLQATSDLRTMVRSRIMPSALRESGLASALAVALQDFDVDVLEDSIERVDEGTEIALLLSVVDVVQQAAHMRQVTCDQVRLTIADGEAQARIALRGLGSASLPLFPLDTVDRVEGLGGRLALEPHASGDTATIAIPTVRRLHGLRDETAS